VKMNVRGAAVDLARTCGNWTEIIQPKTQEQELFSKFGLLMRTDNSSKPAHTAARACQEIGSESIFVS
jgi:hypothetical protein